MSTRPPSVAQARSSRAIALRRSRSRAALAQSVARRRQRGSTLLVAALCLGIAMAALGAIDVGNFYFMRRDLQRTADLAAAAGAQTIDSTGSTTGDCSAATASAQQNAQTGNGLSTAASVSVVCGRWDPSANAGQSYFSTTGSPMNAVQVTVQQTVPYFFVGPARAIQATATAQATDIRSFSITTAVASLSGGLLNGLLNGLLGSNLNLSVASYQGLASAQIRLGDLATALGVGSMSQLLNTQVTVAQLASAMATAVTQSTTASATVVSDLGTIAAAIPGGQQIALGNTSGTNGVLAVALDDPQAAATATVGVLDTLLVAAEIANGQSAINLGTALNLGALASVTAQAKVIEPPVIAVGEAGQNADGTWRTSAHSAQVRVYLNVQLANPSVGLTYLGLPDLVSISALNLPIYIEAGDGTATLQSTQCTTQQATSQSTIVATTGLAGLCIGGDASSNFTNTTTATSCNLPAQITQVSGLGYSLINVSVGTSSPTAGLNLQVQSGQTSLVFNGVPNSSTAYQSVNTNALGSVTTGVLTQLAAALSNQTPGNQTIHATAAGLDVTALVGPLVSGLATLLSPILTSLDALLVPLLQLLGVQIGVSTVHDLGLACGQAQLVY